MKITPGSTAYSYLRMSTKSQIAGDSLRRQEELSTDYAKRNGLVLAEDNIYTDSGISAFRSKNLESGALSELLLLINSGKVVKNSYLLIESFDRLSRDNIMIALEGFIGILNAGVNIVTLVDEQIYFAGHVEPMQLMLSITLMAQANEESLIKSRRLSASWDNKRNKANSEKLTKNCPAWLELNSDRKSFSTIENAVETVQLIYELAVNGQGSGQITRYLNSKKIPTISTKNTWIISYVTKILKNRAVFGEFQAYKTENGKRLPKGVPVTDYYPIIIPEKTFTLVQAGRKNRDINGRGRIGKTKANLFTGLVKCGYCSSVMELIDKGPSPKGGKYLKCSNLIHGTDCVKGSWPAPQFEKSFLTYAHKIDFSIILKNKKSDDKISDAEYKLAKIDTKITTNKKLVKNFRLALREKGANYVVLSNEIGMYQNEITELEAKHKQNISELSELKLKQTGSDDVTALFELLTNSPKDEILATRVKFADGLKGVVKKIECYVSGLKNVDDFIHPGIIAEGYFTQWEGNPTFKITLIDDSEKVIVVDKKNRLQYLFSQTSNTDKKGEHDNTVFQVFDSKYKYFDPNEITFSAHYKNILKSVRTVPIDKSGSGKPVFDLTDFDENSKTAAEFEYLGWLIATARENVESISFLTDNQYELYELMFEKYKFSGVLEKGADLSYEQLKSRHKNSPTYASELIKFIVTDLNVKVDD